MAEQVRLIDISPEELIGRLKAGKVYQPGKVESALNNFFQKSKTWPRCGSWPCARWPTRWRIP